MDKVRQRDEVRSKRRMTVLTAVDGSRFSQWAIEWLGVLPFLEPLVVHALHVIDVPRVAIPVLPRPIVITLRPAVRAEVQRLVIHAREVRADTEKLLVANGLRGNVRIVRGAVADTIMQRAPRNNGLLALGHRSAEHTDTTRLGGIAARVALYAPCSVLVVKQPPRPLRRVLLATDGSITSDEAVGFLCRRIKALLAHPHEGLIRQHVDVVHVLPKFLEAGVQTMPFVQWAVEQLTRHGYSAEPHVLVGDPAAEIQAAAAKFSSDLIVVGATGLGALSRFFLGSVSTRVVQESLCTTLVVRGRHGRGQKT